MIARYDLGRNAGYARQAASKIRSNYQLATVAGSAAGSTLPLAFTDKQRESWRRSAKNVLAGRGVLDVPKPRELFGKADLDLSLRKADPGLVSIAQQHETDLATRLARSLGWLRDRSDELVDLVVNQNRPEDLEDSEVIGDYAAQLGQAMAPVDKTFEGGVKTAKRVRSSSKDGGDKIIAFEFDARNRRIQNYLRQYKMDLIREISGRQAKAVRKVITDLMIEGHPPATMAQRIRETVGLTETQAGHVMNYRRELEELDSAALARVLRDKRFDRTVYRAISSRQPLSEEQIGTLVDAYQRRYIALRAMTIARTEALRAANFGALAAMQSGLSDLGDQYEVVKRWIATKDNRTRDSHRALDGQEVKGLETPFLLPDGRTIRFPQDPEAPANETINCRCTLSFRVVRKEET